MTVKCMEDWPTVKCMEDWLVILAHEPVLSCSFHLIGWITAWSASRHLKAQEVILKEIWFLSNHHLGSLVLISSHCFGIRPVASERFYLLWFDKWPNFLFSSLHIVATKCVSDSVVHSVPLPLCRAVELLFVPARHSPHPLNLFLSHFQCLTN